MRKPPKPTEDDLLRELIAELAMRIAKIEHYLWAAGKKKRR